jgi:acetyl-CoA C-acetyltransferase
MPVMTPRERRPSRRQYRAVLVGVAQIRRKPPFDGPWEPLEPARMMADAVQRAAADAGDPGLIQEADVLACVEPVSWGYEDLVARVGELARVTGPASPQPPLALTVAPGGDSPCELLNDVATRIVEGDARIALLCGADAMYSRRRARKEGVDLEARGWPPSAKRDFLGGQRALTNELEARHGLLAPIQCYPLYENALRAEAGRTIDEHRHLLGELMAVHAAVAKDNPYAWFQNGWSAEEITNVTADNRWICFPYPKRMNAIMEVDQAAAVVIMSSDEADRRQIPLERRVTFLGGASANDGWTPTERASLSASPAYRSASATAFEHAGLYPTEVDFFDLYSCFPCAVELAMKVLALTLDDPRPRTVTGGLAYAGGPGNNYSTHALAATVDRLRNTPAKVGYVSALGMTATKHAVSILSTDPARISAASGRATSKVPVPDKVNFGPALVDEPTAGSATVESYTVEFDRSGAPSRSMFVLRLADGRRTVANGGLDEAAQLVVEEGVGKRGWVEPGLEGGPNHFALGAHRP